MNTLGMFSNLWISKNFKRYTASLLMFGALMTVHADDEISMVKDGKSKSSIIIPDTSAPLVERAAEELQYHIKKASGATVPILKESKKSTVLSTCHIYLGTCSETLKNKIDATKLQPNSFIIKTIGNDLFINGYDSQGAIKANSTTRMGTLFGVYEFLEKQLGAKWLWPGELGEVIPSTRDIVVNQWNQTDVPKMKHNRWRNGQFPEGWSSQEAMEKYRNEENTWLLRQRFIIDTPMDMHHSFTQYWKRFGKTNPEYFNLLPDGTRRPESKNETHVSMDVSNPALWKQIVADWQAKIGPQNQPWIDASEDDTPGKCVCPKCMAWDVPEPTLEIPWDKRLESATEAFKNSDPKWDRFLGELSDRYARFYLSVQNEAEKVDPNAVVMGFAYANYTAPPLKTKLNKRILIGIVPKLMFPWTDKMRSDFRTQWKGWAATGASMLLRPNYTLCGHCFPIFYADKLGEDIAFCAENGMIGTDFDSLTGQWAVQGPNLYMLARILNHPDWAVEKILDEYYSAFGPAKEKVKEYFNHWKKVSDGVTDEFWAATGGGWDLYPVADQIFTSEVMEKGFRILSEAKNAAENDKTASRKVAFLENGLRNAQLTINTHAALRQYKKDGDIDSFKMEVNKLDGFRQDHEKDNISNTGRLMFRERTKWPRKAIGKEWGKCLDILWRFSFDPQKIGKDSGWQNDEFNDSSWGKVPVTDFWTESSLGKNWKEKLGEDYKGTSWYRTSFSASPSSIPCRYFLIFGAVHGPCEIWVNGKLAYNRPYQGPTDAFLRGPFQIEISSLIRFSKPNTVAVMAEYVDGAGGMWKPVRFYTTEAPVVGKKNLVPDPGFEDSENSWKRSIMSGKCELAIDADEKFDGISSASITCTQRDSATKKSWARWYLNNVPVENGKPYCLHLLVKTSPDFEGGVSIWCGDEKVSIGSTKGMWRQIIIEDIKVSGDSMPIYLNLLDGTGKVWFDNIELIEKNNL